MPRTKEEIKAYNAAYRAAHKEELLARAREDYRSNLEERRRASADRMAKSRADDPEKYRAISRAAGKKRKADRAIAEGRIPGRVGGIPKYETEFERREARAKWLSEWREKTANHRKEWGKKYHDEHRDEAAVKRHKRRALRAGAPGNFNAADIEYLWNLQNGHCVMCLHPLFKNKFHVDHHIPLSRGGSNDKGNLRLMHQKCNLSKGARDPAEHALKNGLLCW